MRRLLITTTAALALTGCSLLPRHHAANPYEKPVFYAKYLDPANALDQRIHQHLGALRANPESAPLHNDLGQLLVDKGFPKDAEREFERAVNSDRRFYPAWFNLGLIRASRGDLLGARIALGRTLHYKPGHSAALFQMGLVEERRRNHDAAIDYFAKAFLINPNLLDARINPRILDSRLVDMALLKAYQKEHLRKSMTFEGTPSGYAPRAATAPKAPTTTPVTDQTTTPPPRP